MKILEQVYFDNGATSYPKAPMVAEAMADYLLNNGSNVSRGAYKAAMDASRLVYETRMQLCDLFHFDKPDHVIFTKNITESINQVLKGILTDKDHVITTSMEHNAILRPLSSIGCETTRVHADTEGYVHLDAFKEAVKNNTKMIVMIHGSNVSGSINDIEAIGRFAKEKGIIFVVDAAQTAGVVDINMDYIDVLCFTGHKSLLGPTGTGGFLVQPHIVESMKTLIEGGTGSASELEVQPDHMPDKYESGTPNVVGLYGLHTALSFVMNEGIDQIHKHELDLVEYFINNFKSDDVRIVGSKSMDNRTAVISLDFLTKDNAMVAFDLQRTYNIATRVGMHCAPAAHKSLGTFPNGTVRVSFSYFNTIEEVKYLLDALTIILDN